MSQEGGQEYYSIIEPLGASSSSCGYCHSDAESSHSYGAWAHTLSPKVCPRQMSRRCASTYIVHHLISSLHGSLKHHRHVCRPHLQSRFISCSSIAAGDAPAAICTCPTDTPPAVPHTPSAVPRHNSSQLEAKGMYANVFYLTQEREKKKKRKERKTPGGCSDI
jgi:hypothetical protein